MTPSGRRSVLVAGTAAGLTAAGLAAGTQRTAVRPSLTRRNHRGEPVSLVAGPVTALVATAVGAGALAAGGDRRTALAWGCAGIGSALVGGYDDRAGQRVVEAGDKGPRGHLAALRAGRVSAGAVKVLGIGSAAAAAAALLPAGRGSGPVRDGGPARRLAGRVVAAGLVAGTANLVNLFDLRPGRALKVAGLLAMPLLAGPAGAPAGALLGTVGAALPADLAERTMLGDTGANALGALLGTAAAVGARPRQQVLLLAAVVALTVASERVSFTRVIAGTPVLDRLDRLGRRPAAG